MTGMWLNLLEFFVHEITSCRQCMCTFFGPLLKVPKFFKKLFKHSLLWSQTFDISIFKEFGHFFFFEKIQTWLFFQIILPLAICFDSKKNALKCHKRNECSKWVFNPLIPCQVALDAW